MKKFENLWFWGKKYIWIIFFVFFTTVCLQLLYSYIPLLIQYAIKILDNTESESTLPIFFVSFLESYSDIFTILILLGIIIVVLQALRGLIRFIDSYLKGWVSEKIAMNMRNEMYKKLNTLSYSYHNNSDVGDLIQRCTTDIDTSCMFVSMRLPELVNIIATVSIGAYQVGKINLTLMLVSLISMPIFAISSVIYFNYVNKKYTEIEKSEAKMTTIIQENLAANRVVKAFHREKYEIDKMDKQSIDYSNKMMKFNLVSDIYWGISDCFAYLQYAITLVVSIYLAKYNLVDAGDIVACFLLLGMLIWPVRSLGRIISEFGKTIVSVNRIQEVMDQKSEYVDCGNDIHPITGNLSFENVSFTFPDADLPLLNNISFDIKKGETVAIVGRTGCGKSTIVNLLTRMLEYTDGHIYLDGVELNTMDKKYVRKNIGLVAQDPFLFSKTIYENINITRIGSENDVYNAAKIANIDEDIRNFEYGYDTLVGEKGTTLSGGQKQRIAIARTLISRKPIIIFDDSLSAVDSETDILIRKAIKEANKNITTIVITHRTTTAKEADKIIVLDNGKIIEIGTHEQLVSNNNLYSKLWQRQGKLEEEFQKVLKETQNEDR